MNINQVCSSLYSVSLAGYFNREKFTENRLSALIKSMMRTGSQYIGEIATPYGWRWFKVYKVSENNFSYFVPDTKEGSDALCNELISPLNQEIRQ